jgi:predicted nucleic-acid-binding protein
MSWAELNARSEAFYLAKEDKWEVGREIIATIINVNTPKGKARVKGKDIIKLSIDKQQKEKHTWDKALMKKMIEKWV